METYEKIKELRLKNGLSQEELALKVGYSDRSSIAKVEAGQVDLTQSRIYAFAAALNISPAQLMGTGGISNRLKALIDNQHRSYGDLAKETHIPKSAIHRYATGATEKIPIDRVIALAKALKTSPEFILGWDDEMPEFKDLIKTRRLQIGKTLEQVGKEMGVSKATVQRWESGEIKDMRRGKLVALAKALDTTPAYLMGWDDTANTLPDNIIPMPKMRKIPLLGTIACGEPILAAENLDGEVDIPAEIHADFALRCKGNSMINARIFDGDLVYIKRCDIVDNGEIAAVIVENMENEATLKRVQLYNDHISLEPENPQYRPLVFWETDMNRVRIIGKAVAFTSAVR